MARCEATKGPTNTEEMEELLAGKNSDSCNDGQAYHRERYRALFLQY